MPFCMSLINPVPYNPPASSAEEKRAAFFGLVFAPTFFGLAAGADRIARFVPLPFCLGFFAARWAVLPVLLRARFFRSLTSSTSGSSSSSEDSSDASSSMSTSPSWSSVIPSSVLSLRLRLAGRPIEVERRAGFFVTRPDFRREEPAGEEPGAGDESTVDIVRSGCDWNGERD